MTKRKWRPRFGVALSIMLLVAGNLPIAPALADDPPALHLNSTSSLTPGAREAAELLGILPKVERLIQLGHARAEGQPMGDEELGLKVDVLDRIMGGSLEVRMVTGRIDRELSWAFAGQGGLLAKRQKLMNYLFTANFMQQGILGVCSGPEFLHGDPRAGAELLLLGSSIGLALSSVNFMVQRSGSKKIDSEPTVLTNLFGLKAPEPLHKHDIVTKFMNAVPPNAKDNKTRAATLIEGWKRSHRLRSMDDRNLRKLAAFVPDGETYHEDIRLIAARIRMLFDTQWSMEQLDSELLELMRATDVN